MEGKRRAQGTGRVCFLPGAKLDAFHTLSESAPTTILKGCDPKKKMIVQRYKVTCLPSPVETKSGCF